MERVEETIEGVKETIKGIKETIEGVKETIKGMKQTSQGVKETMQVMLATMLKQVKQWPFTADPGSGIGWGVLRSVVYRRALSLQREV